MQVKHLKTQQSAGLWVAILDLGEEVKATLLRFAAEENILGASFVALGAFQRAVISYFEWDKNIYKPIPVEQQVEVITLVGDIVRNESNAPDLHAHCVLGLPDGSTRGGHLLQGVVRPTLEVTITPTSTHLVRRKRADLGIALIDIG